MINIEFFSSTCMEFEILTKFINGEYDTKKFEDHINEFCTQDIIRVARKICNLEIHELYPFVLYILRDPNFWTKSYVNNVLKIIARIYSFDEYVNKIVSQTVQEVIIDVLDISKMFKKSRLSKIIGNTFWLSTITKDAQETK